MKNFVMLVMGMVLFAGCRKAVDAESCLASGETNETTKPGGNAGFDAGDALLDASAVSVTGSFTTIPNPPTTSPVLPGVGGADSMSGTNNAAEEFYKLEVEVP